METPAEKDSSGKLEAEYYNGEVSDQQDPNVEASSKVDVKKTLRQMDYRVIPIVTVLYLLSFLDRGRAGLETSP